jgi:arylformamidase
MRVMMVRLLILALLLTSASKLVAASWTDVHYIRGGAHASSLAARLDIHAPNAAGLHPVLIWLHGGAWVAGDKRLADEQIARFNAAGQVVVSVEYPLAPARHPAQIEHVAAAVDYVYRNIARYGGDPSRLRLIGAEAGAHLAALLAVDAQWLAPYGLKPNVLSGVVLLRPDSLDLEAAMSAVTDPIEFSILTNLWGERAEGWRRASPWAQIRSDAATPPILLLATRGGKIAEARQCERFADRLREAGVANQTLLLPASSGLGPDGALKLDASGNAAMLAWFDALALPRLRRFENLDFEADFVSGMRDGDTRLRGAEVAFMFPFAGQLVASLSDADPTSVEPARVLIKRTADSDWVQAHAFDRGAQFTLLAGLRLLRSGSAQPLARPVDVMIAGLTHGERGAQWQWAAQGGQFQPLASNDVQSLGAALVHRDKVTGADVVLLGTRGGVRAADWSAAKTELQLRNAFELEGADVVAFAIANGHAFAAVNSESLHGKSGGLYQRIDGAASWRRVADLELDDIKSSVASAMSAVADPGGAGHDVLLIAQAQTGRIVRIDPMTGFGKTLELDIAAGFAEVWGGELPWVDFGSNAFVSLRHPESADQVSAIGLRLRHPQSQQTPHNGAWYLLRRHDGSYSFGLSYDFADPPLTGTSLRSVRALAASPFVEDQGSAFYFGGFDAHVGDRDSAWIYRGAIPISTPQRGLWWDRTHRGHGLDLQPVAGRWMLTLATYSTDGAPVWYAALGQMIGKRFVAERGALTRYRYALDRDPPQHRDAAMSGDVSIRFGLSADQGACASAQIDRSDADALAELSLNIEGRQTRWCIEPMQFAQDGLPTTDGNGLWYAGPGDSGWGISILERGLDGRSIGVAYVYYYDADGEPRWALGSAPVVDGNARYALNSFTGYCPGCARTEIKSTPVGEFVHRLDGLCGDVSGTGSLNIEASTKDQSRFVRERFVMSRLSTVACY